MIVNKKNKLEDFSKMDLDNFEKMLMNSDRGAKYFNKRWYHSGYEATFLDLDNHLIITNDVRGVKIRLQRFWYLMRVVFLSLIKKQMIFKYT